MIWSYRFQIVYTVSPIDYQSGLSMHWIWNFSENYEEITKNLGKQIKLLISKLEFQFRILILRSTGQIRTELGFSV